MNEIEEIYNSSDALSDEQYNEIEYIKDEIMNRMPFSVMKDDFYELKSLLKVYK